jgi:hypothetical protein
VRVLGSLGTQAQHDRVRLVEVAVEVEDSSPIYRTLSRSANTRPGLARRGSASLVGTRLLRPRQESACRSEKGVQPL